MAGGPELGGDGVQAAGPGIGAVDPMTIDLRDDLAIARAAHSAIAGDLRSTRQRIESWGHSARNSLTAMWAAASLLERHADELDADQRRSIAAGIGAEISRLRDLLEEAAVDPPRPTPIAEVVARVVGEVRSSGVEVHTTIVDDAVAIARRIDVGDAIRHLLDNVSVHAPGSAAHVEVRTDHDAVVIAVSDDGPGIDVDLRDELFTCRPTSAPARRSRARGGLAATKALIEALGGALTLEHTSPTGTCISITLQSARDTSTDERTIVL